MGTIAGATVAATATATFWRLLTSGSTVIMQGSCGTSGTDMVFEHNSFHRWICRVDIVRQHFTTDRTVKSWDRTEYNYRPADANAAMFWQQKYLELLVHTNAVIAELNRPLLQNLGAQMMAQQALLGRAQAQSPSPTPESAPAAQPGTRNGAAKVNGVTEK